MLFSACVCRCSEWPEFFARTLYFLVAEKQRLRPSMLIQCLPTSRCATWKWHSGMIRLVNEFHFSNVTHRIQLASFARSHYTRGREKEHPPLHKRRCLGLGLTSSGANHTMSNKKSRMSLFTSFYIHRPIRPNRCENKCTAFCKNLGTAVNRQV